MLRIRLLRFISAQGPGIARPRAAHYCLVDVASDDLTVLTERLRLEPMPPQALRALLDGNRPAAEDLLGVGLPEEFPDEHDLHSFLPVQLRRMSDAPDRRAWMARMMVGREPRVAIGHIGFHGPPELVGRAEMGYTVFSEHRRRGYATEAVRALIQWAQEQGQESVYLSIAPVNAPSLAIARRLGFRQVGVQQDEVDGEELVFRRDLGGQSRPAPLKLKVDDQP